MADPIVDHGEDYLASPVKTAAEIVADQEREAQNTATEVAVLKDAVKLHGTSATAFRPYQEWQERAEPIETSWSDTFPADLGRNAKDILIDAPIAGTTGFLSETFIAAKDLSRFLLPIDSLYYGVKSKVQGGTFGEGVAAADAEAEAGNVAIREGAEFFTPEIANPVAQMEASMIQFMEGFIPVARGLSVLNAGTNVTRTSQAIQATQAAMITSATVFNPDDPNLANLIQLSEGEGGFPDISNALTEFLSTKPGDPASLNRLKNALAEAVAGPIADGFIAALRYGKAQIWAKQNAKQAADAAGTPDSVKVEVETDVDKIVADRAEVEANLRSLGDEGDKIADELGLDDIAVTREDNITTIKASKGEVVVVERGGTELQVIGAEVDKAARGKGKGKALYDEARRQADERGLELTSDVSVTQDAANIWESMARDGDTIIDLRKTEPAKVTKEVDADGNVTYEANEPIFRRKDGTAPGRADAQPLPDSGTPSRAHARPDDAPQAERPKLTEDSIREDFQNAVTPELREQLINIITKGEYIQGDMGWFNNSKFDLGTIETREDLLNVLGTIENIMQDVAEQTGRVKIQTWEQTLELARAVGLNAEQAHQLFADISGGGGLAARMHAAHQTMLANGKRMLELMEIARKTQAPEDIVNANRAIELQAAIMMEVKGSQSEVARAMNAMKMQRAAGSESLEELASAAREFGVRSDYIEKILAGKNDIASINAAVDKATRATIPEMIAEVAVNGLLMNPTTHMVNISSNTSMLVATPWERFVAAAVGKGRTALGLGAKERHHVRAVGRSIAAQVKGMMETFRFTYQALKDGAPVTDVRQRVEIAARPRISARSLGLDGDGALGLTIDKVVAPAIRLPTRLLSAEDEFFKSILVRGELSALAYESAIKAADEKGLSGKARTDFIAQREKFLVENPTVAMHREAIDVARRGTFQETAQTVAGPIMEKLINIHPFIKLVIAPFFRTPMNVIRQTFVDRVPGLNLMMKQNREALAAGGKEGDMVIARMTTGTAAITTGYFLVNNFTGDPDSPIEIVGKRPWDSTGRFDKVADYSIRVGETWYRFNRFDPIGSWLAFAADSTAVLDSSYDPADPEADLVAMDFIAAGTAAVSRNVMDKVWLKSISDIVETLSDLDRRSAASARLAVERLIADQVIKVVPFSSGLRALTKQVDPVMREAWTVADRVTAILPGFSDGLAPRRDELGREIPNLQGANFMINPFAAGPEDMDPLNQELARLDFSWPRLDKSLEGGKIPLNTTQYSQYKFIIGQVEPFPGMPNLENSLRHLTTSRLYATMTDTVKIETIQAYRNAYRQIAQQKLMDDYPELRERSSRILIVETEDIAGRRLQFLRDLLSIAD